MSNLTNTYLVTHCHGFRKTIYRQFDYLIESSFFVEYKKDGMTNLTILLLQGDPKKNEPIKMLINPT
jgi:hypothetical protein